MKTILSFLTGFVLLLSGVVSGQQVLNLQESPPASGLFTARVDDAYSGTGLGNGKVWIFNAEANDRVVFVVRTGVRANSYPVLRVTNSGGGVIAEVSGSADGRCVLNGLVLASPGVYQVSVYSNNTASAFTMQGLLGRGIDLEGEPNDLAVQANPVTATMQAGGFRAGVAGILDGNVDWYDLGVLSSGNGVNLSLQTPTGSTLAGAATAVELYKDDETSPLARAMGGALVQTLAASGHYRMAVRMPGLDGGNLHFHGGQSVDLGNPVALQLTDSQTIEFWIRPDDFNSRQNPYAKAYAGEGTMTLETDGTVNYFYGTGGGNNSPYQTFNTGAALRVGQWQHIALVRDFTSTPKQLRWYIDGQLVAQTEASYFPAAASSLPLTLGTGYAGDFRGSLDELRLWNVARSAADIASNLGHPLSATESGLVAYFAFSEGSGTTVSDATANALSGTISGGPVWEGSPSATLASYVTQGIGAIYLLSVNVSDTVAPEVTDFQSIPTSGYVFDGSTPAPYNMTAQRGNNGQSFVYTLVGDSGGGNIWGTDTYTVDSYLGRAAVHAGVLAPGEMGAVRVTIRPGMGSYLGTSRFGTGSYGYGAYDSSYVIERYRPAAPFTLNGLYSSLYIGFSKAIRESTLAGGVTLVSAGPDGVFGTADDRSYPLSLVRFTPDNRAIFSLGNAILSPGLHRLTVAASVADRSGNTLAAPYSQNFTVAALAHYVNEKGDDNTQATATSLSTHVAAGTPDGSFADFGRTTATAGWPFDVELADFDGDGKLDAVVSHLGSVDGLSIFPGNGDKTFGTPLTFFGLGDESYHIALLDIDKDGKTDIAVTVAGGRFVALFHNDSTPGHISFTRLGNVAVGDWPMRLAVGDINGDGWPDLVCSNNGTDTGNGGYSVSVLLNDQHGGFTETKIGLGLSPRIHPQAIGLGDFNKDGKLDLVVGDMDNGKRLAIFLGNGDGTFGAPSFLDTPDRPTLTDFAIADFNHDGNLDIATMATDNYNDSNGTYDFGVFAGNGDGTFQPRTSINLGYGYYNYFVKTVDVNGDGWPDLVFGGNDHVTVATNRADGSIGFDLMRRNWGNTYGVAVGDLNGDGLPELVITDQDENLLRVLDGNAVSPLAADDPATGLHHGYGRGFLSDNTDLDYWSFTAKRGEMLTVATDLSGISSSPGLNFYVYDEVGNQLTYFYNWNNWSGETPPLAIPRDGTYYLRVSPWYDYRGEYRFRVSLAPPGTQLERENNNWLGESNPLAFTLSGHSLSATVAGYLASYDNSGDFFNLGNLAAGTQVSATLRLPTTSTLAPALTLFKADGSQITPTILTPTQLVYTLQPGDESNYHVRVSATDGKGVMAEYFLDLVLSDVVPPSIVSDSLPAEGSTVTFVGSSFTLGFTEDMLPASVNDMTSYTLLASGGDGTFNNGNEVAYTIRSPGYGSGLTATYFLPDGPLQPDTYRLVVSTGLKDKANNNLAAPHVRTFTVAGLPGYVLENRSNNTQATATSLSTHVAASTADGSFADFGRTTATAGWPFDVELADFDGDGKLDAVVSHLGSVDGLSIFPGNGDKTFGTPLTFFGLGDEPYHIALLDIDKDGKTDIAVTVAGGRFVALFHNNSTPGHLAFTRLGNVAVGDWPVRLAVGDVNGDGWPDLVCSNNGTDTGNGGYSVSVLLNDQHGGFTETKIGLGLSPRIRPQAIGLGDFNKDGKLDLVVGDMDNGKRVAIFLGNGDGTFGAPSFLDTPDRPTLTDFAIADFNHDGNLDIATMATDNYNDSNGTYDFGVFAGNGDGTFQPRTSINMGYGYYNYFVKTVDVNGDGWPDLVFGGNDHVTVATNRADGSIGFDLMRRNWGNTYGVAVGDLNGDGLPELVITDHDENVLRVLDGNAVSPLAADDPATGLHHGYGRGFLSDNTDLDYWSFTAKRGEMLTVAADLSGISGSSGLAWYVYDEVGNQLTYFYNGNNWSGETPPLAIPRDGTYYLRVSPWYDYRGEYRFRVSLAPPGTQLERETNNWLGESNALAFTLSGHSLSATVAGYLASYDNSGDFFNLGNLAAGTQVSATLRLPTTSTLAPALTLFKADGSQITPTILTPTQLVYTLQPGDESTYHVRVSATDGKGVMAEYFLDLALSDVVPPSIVSDSLPAEGSTVTFVGSTFTLGFSEDMLPTSVNDMTSYTLLASGGDGTFNNGNEVAYTIRSPGYGSGLTATYFLPDGPLQPDTYRLVVSTGLKDKANNNMAAPHVRTFTVAGLPGYVLENRSNTTQATATSLSTHVAAGTADGSFADFGRTTATAGWPFDVELADFDGDGKLDAVVSHLGSVDGLSIFPGNGDRTFGTPLTFFGLGDEPYHIALLDIDKDGKTDIAVTVAGGRFVALFHNNSTPGHLAFTRLGNVAVGDWPMRLAVGDVNGDGWPDLVCSNNGTDAGNGGYSVSVLLNDQHGGFTESKIGLGLSPRIRPEAIGLGDFNKDGKLDLVVGDMDNGKRVAIFLGNGDGTFGAPSFLDTPDRPTLTDFAIADFNQDGNLDIATMATDNYNDSNGTYDFGVFAGNGDGTFQPRTSINMGYGYYNYFVKTVDVNGDGWPDLVFGGNDHVTVATNRANGSIGFDLVRRNWGSTYGVAMGDLNGDGVPELVITDHDDNLLRVLDGNAVSPLAADDPATGLQHGYGRGFLADNTDLDYWSFTAKRGEMLTVAADLSGISGSSGLAWYVYDEVGNQLTYFYNGNNWSGETPPLAIPRDGTYYLRVSPWYDYRGEYRFRVSLAPPGTQLERETNNWLGESNGLAFTLSSHSLSATAAGYLASYDNSGDFFNLGNLAVGTQVSATLRLPTTSTLAPALTLFKADGSQVTPTILTPTQLVYTLQPGDESTYHVRVSATAGKGLMAEYFLDLALSDTMPPSIIACTLPTGTTGGLLSAFNLSFNKDMLASTVNNAANYSLVWAGPDGTFATGDDEVFAIAPAGYGNGLSNSYSIVKGPLPPGNYQLRVAGLRDTFNNAQALGFERDFSISQVGGYQTETEPNNSPAAATPLVFNTDIPGYLTANGRGVLVSSEDIEYWTFEAQAGDVLVFETNLPYEPSGYGLSWRLTDADGGVVFDRGITSADIETHAPYTLTKTGAYLLRIDDWYGVRSEHRFRVSLLRGLAHEIEPNDSIATATPLTFTHSGGIDSASVAGMIGTSSGLDYYDLGSLAAGNTVFLTVRRPTGSILGPIVSLYSQAGTLMAETNGVAGDDSAEVQIGESGHYYALVRASYGTAGLNSDYILDARVLPTSAVNFPNLRVTRLDEITLPSLHTGDTIPLSYEVSNVGNLVTNASTWTDRVVLSTNNVYGDADDLQLALITHHGALEPGGSYSVNQTLTLPDGLPGTYYLLVKTDSSNSVDEILQEGDNTTCTVNPFVVGLRDYPDLVVENLAVSGPDPSGNWQLGWNLANRGSGVAAPGHSTRVQVLNTSSGQVVVDQNLPAGGVSDPLAAGATLPQSQSINAAAPGYYVVTVSADAGNVLYEYAAGGHALAEQNSVQTNFQVYHYYDISVAAAPAAGGAVTGAGSAREGLPVTVIATPNTSSLPYAFLNWTEDGTFVSSQATYTFTPTRNRNLLAVFGLPQFQVAAVASPVGYGSVTGSGNFPLNTTVVLTPVATAGYVFDHWQENAVNIGTSVPLQFSVAANRSLVAVFRELVPAHVVTLACQPPGVGALAGGGTYTNGQTLAVSAASRVEQGDLEFLFQRFELNGQFFSSGNALNKTFSTLDAATMNFVAVYQQRSLKPVVGGVACSRGVLVPIAPDVTFTVTFDRDMNPAIAPVLALLSGNASAVPVVPAGGTWLDARNFRSLPVAFGASNGGGYTLRVSGGSDLLGHTMDPDASFGFTMDALAPVNPVLVVSATTPTSATLSWADYEAPVDLSGFRYFLEDHTFTSVAGLSAKGGGSTGARSNVFSGLLPDHEYFAAVTAVDVAGNSDPAVSAVRIFLRSQTPPPVTPLLTTTGVDSAHLDWSAYDTSALVGFAGFRVFAASTPLTDITGLTPLAGLPASANSYDLTGLDRTQTHYFAVIGYNVLNQFNPSVTAVMWSDPLAGTLRGDLAIGGAAAVIPVFANLVIDGGATLTIAPGSTLRFADGTGIEVRNGRILANGTDLLPIHFTAAADDGAAGVPLRGAWAGITLGSAAAPVSEISRAWLRYGSGLRITAGSPLVTRLYAIQNAGGGLDVSGSGAVAATGCYLAFNENGLRAMESATVHLHQSVILNNTTVNALQQGSATLDAASNWWGSADADVIAAGLSGSVGAATPLAGEPVLGSAVAAASGVTDTGVRSVQLRLMGVNPVQYRASENSLFTGTLFNDLFPADVSFRIRPYGFQLPFTLSSGAGLKTVHVQTNSATGTTGPDVTVTFNYITDGPVVTAFSLVEGQTVSRPLVVSGSATAALGVKWIDLLIDGVLVARNSAATFATLWDSRSLGNGMHRAELRARDQAGNESSRAVNIVTAPAPPPAPVIAAPLDGLLTNAATVALSGTAEAGIGLRVTRNGSSVSGSLNAAPDGSFNLPAVPLVEGTNTLVVTAFDGLGSSSSAPVGVVHDSGPPAAPVLLEPVYSPSRGLQLEWQYAASGERPTKFRVLWKHEAFSDPAQASGQSDLISGRTTLTIGSMPDATWYFAVVGYDDSGNASVLSNLRSAVLDFTKPSFTISYDGSIPVGPRTLGIILTSSEPLTANPVLTISAAGSGEPVSVPVIRQSATVFTAAFVVSDLSATTGTATVNVSATDLVGNSFSGPPSGPDLVFDVTKPTATLSLDHPAPVQTLNPVSVALGLQLSEAPALGTSPTLAFDPPVGARVVIALTGSGTVWTGNLTLNAAMGRGTGFFRLSVTDAAGNSGTVITPSNLEIYNTELPDPPTRPGGLSAQTLAHGHIAIRWDAVPRAESYKIYREPGNNATVPVLLLADGLNACEFTDTPPADGIYTYAIVAALRGADSLPSGVLNALSDRTPPPAPEDFVATLGATGVALSWAAPSSGEVPHHYNVYRGAELIYSSTTPVSFQDNPPRGIHDYRVSSVDSHGNENATPVLTIEMLVSPVTNLQILVRDASPTSMTWDSTDPTVTGFNVYRNGVKQNGGPIPLADRFYIDPLTLGVASVSYEITALNAARNESPRRRLVVVAADFSLLLNPDAAAAEHDSVRFYFDSLRVVATNLAVSGRLAIEHLDLVRTVGGSDALSVGIDTNLDVAPGGSASQDFVVLAPRTLATQQSIQLLARGPADASGSRVSFEKSFVKRPATDGGNSASLQPVTPPLAGGLTDFVARIANPGPVPIEIIIGRGFGNLAGDVSVRVLDASGAEVSRKDFKGSGVSGVTMDGNGNAFITIAPGGSVSFTIPQIFVPEALGHAGQGARFVLDIAAIRYRPLSGSLLAGGTLSGQTSSSLVQTPYYGTSATNKAFYANDEPVHITGQAIDRASGLPLAHAALHLGFGARGFVTWQTVTTDDLGAYAYDYTPVLGFSGRLNIWAAHPDVVDQLNQVTIDYRRLYVTPGRGDVVMSKNDTLDITLKAINPGDLTAASVAMSARAFVMNGDTEVDITTIRAALIDGPFAIAPNGDQNVAIRFTADANAPDTALINLTFLSAEGASCTFRGTLSLRPAVPVLSFVSPRVGYVEGSVNRGNINSYVVTLENLGLRAVENPVLIPPASMRWMDVNLPRAADGRVVLPDIPVGGRLTFGVAFAPPDTTALGFYDDFIEIQGSNLQTPFHVNLFAQVTSSLVGSVKFVVDNIFVERVPNAKVRLRNPNLREELGPFLTDSNGEVTIPNLQEGSWSWQITAAGHSTQTGTVDIVPGQLGLVETRLSKSLVTVEFSVVPKPFTDRYEIVIEQTFETRVPFPVLVFDPPSFAFTNLPDQYESTLLVKVRNEGLISMFDVQLTGDVSSYASLQPLINYLPELHAQEEVVVPFHLVWSRHGLGGGGSGPVLSSDLGGAISGCADAVFKPNILDDDFMAGINAIGRAIAQCADGATAALICSLIVTIDTLDFIMGFTGLEAIAETIGKFLGCIVAQYKSDVPTGIGGGGGGGGNGSFTGSGCFPAGTPVTLGDGSRVAIESLQRGTAVRSSMWAGHCGQVEDVIIRHSNDLRELSFCEVRPGTTPLAPADLRLKITGEHLVWNDASGWTAAANLKPGDWVHHESGALLAVVSNVSQPGEHTVYTIEVKGGNAFFASGIMVQDLCGAQKLGDRSALAPNSQPATVPAR